jgi:hypothetical protein
MIRKIILGATLSLFAMSALANTLTITNKTRQLFLFVNCNNSPTLPVLPNISFARIAAMFPQGPAGYQNTYQCNFSGLTGGAVGSATIKLMPGFQTAQVVKETPAPGYGVNITPATALTQPVSDISVTLN